MSDYFFLPRMLPKAWTIDALAPSGWDPTHPKFPSRTRMTNQRAAALYWETLYLTRSTDSVDTTPVKIKGVVRRYFAGGASLRTAISSAVFTYNGDNVHCDALTHSSWQTMGRPGEKRTQETTFIEAIQGWEDSRNVPILFEYAGELQLTTYVSNRPLFVPLTRSDLEKLMTPDPSIQALLESGQHLWAELAKAVEKAPGTMTMDLGEEGRVSPFSTLHSLIASLGEVSSVPLASSWTKIPEVEYTSGTLSLKA